MPTPADRSRGRPAGGQLLRRARHLLEGLEGRVAVVGSLNADLTVRTKHLPRPGETVSGGPMTVLPGGKSANQAVACALLGARPAMIGAVGADEHGAMLLDSLRRAGVDTTGVLRRQLATGTAVITVDAVGENTIVVSPGANAALSGADVHRGAELIRRAAVLGLCLEIGDEALVAAARVAREAGARVVLNPSPMRAIPAELSALTDVLVLNEHELAQLSGSGETGDDTMEMVRRLGVPRAVVTLGSRGCRVIDGAQPHRLPAFAVKAVDTTGCGDAFTGTLLAALASGGSLVDGAAVGAAVAALAASSPGAQRSYPDRERVRAFLDEQDAGWQGV
ncbi:ribokinase [Propionibacterium cyclohexanicum]|uniref:ribokinase n=1 Tax=Propionibacterium cyclohexanicum TaxID=64702 RepID=UPI001FE05717|nr:ribokinase [Propionibacterium cyclohexanicum]